MTKFPASANHEQGEAFFGGFARERGNRHHVCFLLGSPTFGVSTCNNDRAFVALSIRERDDGSTMVETLVVGVRRDSRWRLRLSATGAASRQVVDFDDHDTGGGIVESRVVFTGVQDPRLRLVASNKDQGRCLIGLDPANATTDAPLKMQSLDRLIASRT
jgi:hypothetical protein